jgi:hypothetical protein
MGGISSGAAAVAKLSNKLSAVAAAYDRTPQHLTHTLLSDKDLLLDANSKLLYKCTGLQLLDDDDRNDDDGDGCDDDDRNDDESLAKPAELAQAEDVYSDHHDHHHHRHHHHHHLHRHHRHHHHHHRRKLAQHNVELADPQASNLNQSATGVPLVHSRTSAKRKIFLDFDGHTTIGEGLQGCGILRV